MKKIFRDLKYASVTFSVYSLLRFDVLIAIYFILLAIYLKLKND